MAKATVIESYVNDFLTLIVVEELADKTGVGRPFVLRVVISSRENLSRFFQLSQELAVVLRCRIVDYDWLTKFRVSPARF